MQFYAYSLITFFLASNQFYGKINMCFGVKIGEPIHWKDPHFSYVGLSISEPSEPMPL